jgi:lipoyl synthase
MAEVVDAMVARAAARWGSGGWERADVVWRHTDADLAAFTRGEGPGDPVRLRTTPRRERRLVEAGVTTGLEIGARKPDWMRAPVRHDAGVLALRRTLRDLDLVTVCEEAGCPNLSECWSDGTATFMINGERCTRACGFCLVDTRHPDALDPGEPARVAEAVARMGLRFAVVTAVARDDLPDGGAAGFVETIRAIRRRSPGTSVEVLIPDCKGDPDALEAIFAERPDVPTTTSRPSPACSGRCGPRPVTPAPSPSWPGRRPPAWSRSRRSSPAWARPDEMVQALADLRGVGVDIVTIGQYLRPTTNHLPVARWWTPEELTELKAAGEAMGIAHVEAGPLVRSSYHARQAADAAS